MPTHTLAEMTPARRTLRRHLLTIQDLAAALLQLDDLTQTADLDTLKDRAYNAALPLTDALKLIRNARDYFAEHGEYQPDAGPDGVHQQFDDWAADLADRALAVNKVLRDLIAEPPDDTSSFPSDRERFGTD